MKKRCSQCGSVKDIELFARDKNCSDGHRSYCKACHKKYQPTYVMPPKEPERKAHILQPLFDAFVRYLG